MTAFVFVMAICGIVATFFLNWVFLVVIGLVFVPACILTMVALGTALLPAIGQAVLGYVVLQVAYCLAGWGMALFGSWRGRPGHPLEASEFRPAADDVGQASGGGTGREREFGEIHASMTATPIDGLHLFKGTPLRVSAKLARFGATPRSFPLFGGWLPLAAFYDPPCHADGRPWNGRSDPGYRMTILVVGWFNHAVSLRVSSPKPLKARPSRRELDSAVTALDERIQRSRARASETESSPPRDEG